MSTIAIARRASVSVLALLVALAATLVAFGAPASATTSHAQQLSRVYAIGDSVMIDARSSLYAQIPGISVDAAVSRQTGTGIGILQSKRRNHTMNHKIVFGLGTNGSFTAAQVQQVINLTAGHKLVIVTTHCPYCSWTKSNNNTVNRLCTVAHHCWVARFAAEARTHPGWFSGDGVHMASGSAGAREYARLVQVALKQSGR